MRRLLLVCCALAALLVVPATAGATISSVFTSSTTPVACTVQTGANAGMRFCGTSTAKVPSWDGTPIDVSVTFPAATDPDASYPLVGIYHGWGGTKITPSSAATLRWVNKGYAVFSMSDRGWGQSCGGNNGTNPAKAAPCTNGYIHLMHNAYEVRDAQYLMGLLADDGVIDPQKIAATGASYGGGISMQLGALRNRVQLPDGTLQAWKSPAGTAMQIAATTPEYGWSDLDDALLPNGSSYDYVARAPYRGPNGDRRVGVEKQNWNQTLNSAGAALGYYAPTTGTGFPDPAGNMTGWFSTVETGGPYDTAPAAQSMVDELYANHSADSIDDSTVAPAPALLSNGWDDDLFPADESLRYYNHIRTDWPNNPMTFYGLDFGHSPRASGAAADVAKLTTAENAWVDYYVRGIGAEPTDAKGGVDVITSKCTGTTKATAGDSYHAKNWAALAAGEVQVGGGAPQTIAPGNVPSSAFTSGNVCANGTSAADTTGAAVYKSAAATSGYTIAGSPTVTATYTVTGANDFVAARLYDYDPTATTEKLIGRGTLRPNGVGAGPTKQTFQLHPQAYAIAAGHQVKLELLSADSTYLRTASVAAPQQPIAVSGLQLRLPTIDAPGGQVVAPSAKVLPAGYALSHDELANDTSAPTTTDDVPATWSQSDPLAVTLTATDVGDTGVAHTYYTVGTTPATPTTSSSVYDPASKPTLTNGQKISYFSVDVAGNVEAVHTSSAAQLDGVAPVTTASPAAGVRATPVAVTLSATDARSGVATTEYRIDGGSWTAYAAPVTLSVGTHTVDDRSTDVAGNVEPFHTNAYDVRDPALVQPTTAVTAGSALVHGLLGPNVTDYEVLYRPSTTTTWSSAGKTAVVGSDPVSKALSGLLPQTTYYVKLRAYQPSQAYAYSAIVSFTTPATGLSAGDVTVAPPSDTSTTGATVSATVDTHAAVTTGVVEYGTTASYGRSLVLYRSGTTDPVAFTRALVSLAPNTVYHYRFTFTNSTGTVSSADQTLTTATPTGPIVNIGTADPVGPNTATINTTVDGQGAAVSTTSVQWGTTTGYGKSLPLLSGAVQPDGSRIYTRPLISLKPNTTYHYQVVVSTSYGTTTSTDRTFTTTS